MEAEKTSYRPFEYLDRMEGNNHIVLLYDNSKVRRSNNRTLYFQWFEKR